MKYRIDFTQEEHETLIRLLEEKLGARDEVEQMIDLVNLYKKIDEDGQEI